MLCNEMNRCRKEIALLKWIKENAIDLIMLIATLGSGISAFATDAGSMFAMFPLQASLLLLFAFLLGFAVFRFLSTQTRLAADKRTLEKVKGLPPQLIAAIRRAYVDGAYTANYYDTNVQYLLGLGFLGAPANISILDATPFVLQPWFKSFLDRNHAKVFGN